jgi:hypothetical protein
VDTAVRRSRASAARRRARPGLGFTITVGCLAGAIALLTALSHATAELELAVVGGGLIGVAVVVALAAGPRRGERWHWVVVLVTLVLVGAAYETQAPMRARWAVSQSAFDRMLTTLPPTVGSTWSRPGQAPVTGRVGLYRVSEIDIVPAGYLFRDPDGGQLSHTGVGGVAYLPAGPGSVPADQRLVLTHLRGPWYAYWQAS